MEAATINKRKRKEAGDVRSHQPLANVKTAPSAAKRDSTLESAELQQKMEEASAKFVGLYQELSDSAYDLTPAPGQTYREAYEKLEASVWGDRIFCTPIIVMFRLGSQWFKLTCDSVARAARRVAEDEGVSPEAYTKIALRDVRH